jgi:hypothetical protein
MFVLLTNDANTLWSDAMFVLEWLAFAFTEGVNEVEFKSSVI